MLVPRWLLVCVWFHHLHACFVWLTCMVPKYRILILVHSCECHRRLFFCKLRCDCRSLRPSLLWMHIVCCLISHHRVDSSTHVWPHTHTRSLTHLPTHARTHRLTHSSIYSPLFVCSFLQLVFSSAFSIHDMFVRCSFIPYPGRLVADGTRWLDPR